MDPEDEFLCATTDHQEDNNKIKNKSNLSNFSNNNNGSPGKKGANGGGGGGVGAAASSMKCCQAEKCTADLGDAKQYHKRHKVCEHHAKAQMVVVGGIPQRFCQQCSRFHELSEFDESKRSCRRRLAGHNERRRKNSTDPSQTDASSSSSSSSSSGRKGTTAAAASSGGYQMKEIVRGQVDDHHRGRIQIINIPENPSYKHFQIR